MHLKENNKLVLKKLIRKRKKTANEIIQEIKETDDLLGNFRNWKFYVHLNKLFAPMERAGLIQHAGYKQGDFREEKLWSRK